MAAQKKRCTYFAAPIPERPIQHKHASILRELKTGETGLRASNLSIQPHMTPQLTEPTALAGVEACGGLEENTCGYRGRPEGMPYIRNDLPCHCGPLTVGTPAHSLSSLRGAHKAIDVLTTAICSHKAMGPEQGGTDAAKASGASKLGRRGGSPLLQESLQRMDHAGQHLGHLLLPNHINCPSVKLIGSTLSVSGDIEAFDVINFGS